MANEIMIDSAEDNALRTSYTPVLETGVPIPQAELMGERTIYGTLQGVAARSPRITSDEYQGSLLQPVANSTSDDNGSCSSAGSMRSKKQEQILVSQMNLHFTALLSRFHSPISYGFLNSDFKG